MGVAEVKHGESHQESGLLGMPSPNVYVYRCLLRTKYVAGKWTKRVGAHAVAAGVQVFIQGESFSMACCSVVSH